MAAAFALALATPAAAQQRPTFAPSHMAAARDLLQAMQVEKTALASARAMLEQQLAANPAMAPYRATMLEWAESLFTTPEAMDAFAAMYAEAFPEEDLRQLAAFYRTPLGTRLASRQGEMARRGAEVGARLAESKQADLIARIQAVDAARAKP